MTTRHYAAVATSPAGEVAIAVAHMGSGGRPVLDEVKVMAVSGGEAGIDAVYRNLRRMGFEVNDERGTWPPGVTRGDVRERAIADALTMARKAGEQ